MSTATQGQFCSSFTYNTSDQQYLQENIPTLYTTRPETTMQLFSEHASGEVYCNQYEAPIGESQSQGYVVSQPNSIPQTSIQENQAAVAYTFQRPEVVYRYQWTGADCTQLPPQTAPSYQVVAQPTQALQYCEQQVLATTQTQGNGIAGNQLAGDIECQNGILQKKLIQHEPCIHTLLKLEADVEALKKQCAQQQQEVYSLKQSCERKDITICVLKQHLSKQECEITSLKTECKEKDISIEVLNSEKALEPTESKEIELPRLQSRNSGQQVEISHLSRCMNEEANGDMKQELARLRLENRDVIRLQAKLCKLEVKDDEHERMKAENLSQRQEIARLERRLQMFEEGTENLSPSIDGVHSHISRTN